MNENYKYDENFYLNEDNQAKKSAEKIIPYLVKNLSINSALDVGCGTGSWLSIWSKLGVNNFIGVDFMKPSSNLRIPLENYIQCDLSKEDIPIENHFDFAQCLECLEHVPKVRAEKIVNKLCCLTNKVLFSAATPGQGGENHINEQSLEYWRMIFKKNNFIPFDPVRTKFKNEKSISFWYRNNVILYVNADNKNELSEKFIETFIPDDILIPNYQGKIRRFRNKIISFLPLKIVNLLAKIKTVLLNLNANQ